jgi:hypothetical protein
MVVVVVLPFLRRLLIREWEILDEDEDDDELLELELPSDEERPHLATAASTIAARVPRLRPRPPDDTDEIEECAYSDNIGDGGRSGGAPVAPR